MCNSYLTSKPTKSTTLSVQPNPSAGVTSLLQQRLLARIDSFCKRRKISPTGLGREALGDTSFVHRLRAGREPREATKAKVLKFMAGYAR